jgi:NAD(P)H-dependent FMN reductase
VENEITVVAISGSLRAGSYTNVALQLALEGAREVGAQARLLDLNDYQLTFDDVYSKPSPGTLRMRREVRQAHGILLGTPEYHSSYSGVLKHALDLMGFDEFEGKLVGLVGVAGGKMGAINALNSLRTVGRSLHAWVVPEQVSIAEVKTHFAEDGMLNDAHLESMLKDLGRQVARFAFLHHSAQAREFLRLWETAPVNPGGRIVPE